ncbi:hypothetical protein J3D55_004312 [Chryseobacterium ginsenosidimutans]|uniref:hypothetical protein n=1 Tax=Chryseobacterium ginsenosidimutans TaxID=687846 RepID=UPI002167D0B7|nr:hypothetical protein [Chryseobacterium ginsenosidimutans]MCS3871396.1 hypothetical protein [Chryseobacterium ginsenosidimutans]
MNNSEQIRKNLVNNQAFLYSVVNKANQDSSFKASLLSDSENTLKAFHPKFKVPSGYELIVEDQPQLNTVYVDLIKTGSTELSEQELELIAGGAAVGTSLEAAGSFGCVCVVTW